MRIGIVIGRIGGIDGVALETEKWIAVLQRLGHETAILTGELEAPAENATVVPEMAFSHPACIRGQDEAFFFQDVEETTLLARLRSEAAHIKAETLRWIRDRRVDVLITENCTTLPCHLSMGMALEEVIEETGIPTVTHDHDFYWERGDRYWTNYAGVREIIEKCFPPKLPNLKHVVINSYCQESIRRQMDIVAANIPNVMDFAAPFGLRDEFNREVRSSLGLAEDDVLLFQVTRIVRRKGIETAIDLVHRLRDPRVKLVVTGTAKDDWKEAYYNELRHRVRELALDSQVLFAGDRFANVRSDNGTRIFSLSDGYATANACTYFSRYEGFGNAFVEALVARKPIFVNNYRPVYWADIGSKGFRTVQIEESELTEESVCEIRDVLADGDRCRDIAEFNFELGREHFSYEVLERRLRELLAD